MGTLRGWATWLLRVVSRWVSHDDERWARAMLRELVAIDDDRDALFWALGSTTALLRRVVALKNIGSLGRKIGGLLSHIGLPASVYLLCAAGVLRLTFDMFPGWQADNSHLVKWFASVVIPELAFWAGGLWFWRTRRFRLVGPTR